MSGKKLNENRMCVFILAEAASSISSIELTGTKPLPGQNSRQNKSYQLQSASYRTLCLGNISSM